MEFPVDEGENLPTLLAASRSAPQMLLLYSRTCPYCRDLLEAWWGASRMTQPAQWHGVDGKAHPEVARKFKVDAYPTIVKLAWGDTAFVYARNGPRTVDGFSEFANCPCARVWYEPKSAVHAAFLETTWKEVLASVPCVDVRYVTTATQAPTARTDGPWPTPVVSVMRGNGVSFKVRQEDHTFKGLRDALTPIAPKTRDTAPKDAMDVVRDKLKTQKRVLVLFFAPGCVHCDRMRPEWQLVRDRLPHMTHEIDATQHSDVADAEKIVGFPTLRLYIKDMPTLVYDGNRVARDIVEFASSESANDDSSLRNGS